MRMSLTALMHKLPVGFELFEVDILSAKDEQLKEISSLHYPVPIILTGSWLKP